MISQGPAILAAERVVLQPLEPKAVAVGAAQNEAFDHEGRLGAMPVDR